MLNVASKLVLFFAILLGSQGASAASLDTPAEGLNKILISLNDAQVDIKEVKNLKQVKIQISGAGAEQVLLERNDHVVELRLKASSSKDMFAATGGIAVNIQSPPIATDVFLYEGQVSLQGLSKSTLVRNLKGKISAKDSSGEIILSLQKGEVSLVSHTGSAKIESNRALVTVSKVNGDLALENFAGDSTIDGSKGQLRIKTATGTTRVSKSSGSLQFEVGRGLLSSNDFSGRTDGEVQEATVNLTLNADSEMNLKNQNGKITISNSPQTSPSVSVNVEDGELFVPGYLKIGREGNLKYVRGRLRGGEGGGSLVIRSAEGVVTLR
jgi:hypothetical protein